MKYDPVEWAGEGGGVGGRDWGLKSVPQRGVLGVLKAMVWKRYVGV